MQKKDCVFPFTYKGVSYNKCTDVGSDNGATWCATEVRDKKDNVRHGDDVFAQVDVDGEVVKNTWQDCQDGCPGTSRNNDYFIIDLKSKLLQTLSVMKDSCSMLMASVSTEPLLHLYLQD